VDEIEVVVAHRARATLRVGEVFLKIDPDSEAATAELAALEAAPVPTPEVLWHQPPVLALGRVRGEPIARLGEPSTASPRAWAAAGVAVRRLHDAPPPSWRGRSIDGKATNLDEECEWLVSSGTLPADLVDRNREISQAALRPFRPVFMHGDLHVAHVFVRGDEVTGILDWSEAGQGDGMFDLASLTLGHREHLDDVLAGYGDDVDRDAISGRWSLRSLTAIRRLVEHGFDPFAPGCEVDVLRSQV
jgi:aminoglycoside phosphotransferase (APT) family kinase protein